MQKKSKKLLSFLLSAILILGLLPAGVLAEDVAFTVTASDCTVIGSYMSMDAYLYTGPVPEGAKQVVFGDFAADGTELMSLTDTYAYLSDTNAGPLSKLYTLTKENVSSSSSWELEDDYADYSFENCLAFFLMDADYNMATYVIVYESEPDTTEYDLSFTVTVGDTVLDSASFEKQPASYTYYDYVSQANKTVDTYVVTVPKGTENVTLTFPENRLAYNYTKDGTYLGGYYPGDTYKVGALTAAVPLDYADDATQADGEIDYVQVQTPYDDAYNSVLLYAVTFRYEEEPVYDLSFTVTVGDAVLDSASFEKQTGGYSYYDYASQSNKAVDAYVVTVPKGTESVTLTFPENRLAYNYTKDGNYLGGNYPGDTYMVGALTATVPLDYSDDATQADGEIDYVQVQTPYDASYNSAILYAVTFRYAEEPVYDLSFTVTAGDTVLDSASFEKQEGGYTYYDYVSQANKTVDTYVVTVPKGTESVTLTFPENRLAYNYTKDGTYLGGYYPGDTYMVGALTAAVPLDYSDDATQADGEIDYVQVQTPYDASYNSAILYAVTFRYEEEPVYDLSFTVTAGDTVLDSASFEKQEGGYSYYDYASQTNKTVDAYVVTVPKGTESVTLTFPENRLAYNYTKDGNYLGGNYPGDTYMVGALTATVPLDYSDDATQADGEIDYVQVQTPYDASYNSAILYAVTFRYEDGGTGTGEPTTPGGSFTPEEVRDAIAARYAASGVVSDPNGPWLASDMMAYLSLDPATANRLSDAEKQAIIDKAIDTIETTTSSTDVARYVITLSALGCDPTQLTASDGTALNAREKLDSLCFDNGTLIGADGAYYCYSLPYLMIAYQQLDQAEEALAAMTATALEIKAAWLDTTFGPDGLTPFLLALAPYKDTDTAVAAVIQEALGLLRSLQAADGSVGNAASTGLAIAGVVAVGLDPTEIKSAEGKSLVDGLMVNTSSTGDAFEPTSSSYSTEQGFRGLIALAHAPGYRIYDFKALAKVPAAATAQDVVFTLIPAEAAVTVVGADGNAVAQTGRNSYNGLAAGTYSYTVSLEGYEDKTGTFTITEGGAKQKFSVSLSRIGLPEGEGDQKATVTITVRVLAHDAATCENKLSYKNDPNRFFSILNGSSYTVVLESGVGTARDALIAALDNSGVAYVERSDGYFTTIGGYEELDHGGKSGWMYLVNGESPSIGAGGYIFSENAVMIWYYTDDYTLEYGSEEYQEESGSGTTVSGGGSGTGGSTDGAEKPAAAETEPEPSIVTVDTAVEDGVAAAKAEDAAVAAAAKDESKGDVVLQVQPSEEASTVSVEVSAEALKAVADADKALVFAVGGEEGAPEASVEIRAKDLGALAQQGETISVQVQKNEDGSLTIDVSAGEKPAELDGGIKLSVASKLEPGQVLAVVNEDGTETVVRKSAAEDGVISALLESGATVKVIDNAKDFGDIPGDAWYADAVDFVSSHELFVGDENGDFNPKDTMTRAMMATVMYRLEGEPDVGTGKAFADVTDGKWYSNAINWASAAGVMNGYGESFGVNDPVTREQMAVLIYNYVQSLGIHVETDGSAAAFSDAGDIHSWAAEAMAWAVGEGIFQGDTQGRLNPTGQATRADVATLMERVVKLLLK